MADILSYRLKDILLPSKIAFDINPFDTYKQIKVKGNHRGVELRGTKKGSDMGSKQFLARRGQFILSKIDARNGAMGMIPEDLNNALVTGDFLLFDFNTKYILPEYFSYITKTAKFDAECKRASEGSTNRVRLKVDRFMNITVSVPALSRQAEIVATVEAIQQRVDEVNFLRLEQAKDLDNLLFSKYSDLISDVEWMPMKSIAPIVRRPVSIAYDAIYPEVGIRCFGKGTFLKPALRGSEIGSKKIFQIKKGDIVFSNVFAWEGGIAVANENDNNRYGSHRFISCVADSLKVETEFLCFHFLSPQGLADINACSPGGAGRNKTLGLTKLMKISVPIPKKELQTEFVQLIETVKKAKAEFINGSAELKEIIPGFLDRSFKENLAQTAIVAPESVSVSLETLSAEKYNVDQNDLQIAIMLALIESKLGISYGEVGLQKTVYNIETFYPALQKKYDFVNYHYGTYSTELRDKLKANALLIKKKVSGNEVYTISPEDKKLVLNAITGGQYPELVDSVNKVLDIYAMPFINKETEKIELLNTVAKLMTDLNTSDVDVIYEAMENWNIKQNHFQTKAEKFSRQDTRKTIELLESLELTPC